MTIQWLGHSCFRIEADGYAIVLDPYADGSVPGLSPLHPSANEVLVSHQHGDHNAVQAVKVVPANAPSPFTITRVESVHDDADGTLRGPNTIHILEANGLRVCHLGDLGTMLTRGQLSAVGLLDALMLPVGGHYTIDARTAMAIDGALRPTVTLPMHYRTAAFGFDVIAPLEDFLALASHVKRYDTDTLELSKATPVQTAVLAYRGA